MLRLFRCEEEGIIGPKLIRAFGHEEAAKSYIHQHELDTNRFPVVAGRQARVAIQEFSDDGAVGEPVLLEVRGRAVPRYDAIRVGHKCGWGPDFYTSDSNGIFWCHECHVRFVQ